MSEINQVQLQCLKCKTWSPSPIQFGDHETFDSALLEGNTFVCPSCGSAVPCNKENMRFGHSDGKGGFVGLDVR